MFDKLKKEVENIEIKTTSDDILSEYKKRKQRKTFKFPTFVYPLAFVSVLLVGLFIFIFNLDSIGPSDLPGKTTMNRPTEIPSNNTNATLPTVNEIEFVDGVTNGLNDSSVLGRLSLELFYASNMTKETVGLVSYDDSEIDEVIEDIHSKYDMINSMYSNEEGLSFTYNKENITYDGVEYNYLITVEGYKLYVVKELKDKEYNSRALYLIDGNYYVGNIKIEADGDETEIKLSYNIDGRRIVIEREIEEDESCFKYKVYDSLDELLHEHSISIENEDELELEYKLKVPKKDKFTTIKFKGNKKKLNIVYKMKLGDNEKNIKNITLDIDGDKLLYSYNNKKVEKNKN